MPTASAALVRGSQQVASFVGGLALTAAALTLVACFGWVLLRLVALPFLVDYVDTEDTQLLIDDVAEPDDYALGSTTCTIGPERLIARGSIQNTTADDQAFRLTIGFADADGPLRQRWTEVWPLEPGARHGWTARTDLGRATTGHACTVDVVRLAHPSEVPAFD